MSWKRSLDQWITTRWEKSRFKSVPHIEHVRAELDQLARQVWKLKRECSPAKLRCHDEADFIEAYNRALNDVLALIREARR